MKNRKNTRCVIFHHSLSLFGDVDVIRQWHRVRGYADIGYHFVIKGDGEVQPGRPIEKVGAHAKGRNADSVGVCLVGDFSRYEPTDKHIQAAYNLFGSLVSVYGKKLRLEFHHETCPGMKLYRHDFLEILNRVKL